MDDAGYSLDGTVQRFDQKYNMIYQGDWNPRFSHLSSANFYQSRVEKARQNLPGFSRLDWAYCAASTTNLAATSFKINIPNAGGTSWQSLARSGSFAQPDGLPEWTCQPTKTAAIIKHMARTFGADDVGVALLDRRWVYARYYDTTVKESFPIRFNDESGYARYQRPGLAEDKSLVIPSGMRYVIVFIHEMDSSGIATAPRLTHMAATYKAYSEISYVTMAMAEFIRALGYQAIPSSNDTALNIPLAIDAGLGELSRNAKLIHPVFGPRCRISKIITDLPLDPDSPISFGVTAFCDTCKKCAKTCPSRAIPAGGRSWQPAGDFSSTGVLRWQVDHARCRDYWVKAGTNCGICIHSCPYNKPRGLGHKLVKSVIAALPWVNRFVVLADDLLGYGKTMSSEEYWRRV